MLKRLIDPLVYAAFIVYSIFRLAITPIKTNPNNLANIEQDGALIPGGPIIAAMQAFASNGSPAFGNWSQTLVPNSLAANTMTGPQMTGGIIRRFSPATNFTDSTDTATNIVNSIPGAVPLQTFPLIIANLGSGIMTVGAGTGVTIAGTATIASAATRLFLGQITGSAAVTLTSLFQWGNGSQYTGTVGL